MLNHLGRLVQSVVQTCPIKNSHPEQAQEDQIVDMRLVHLSEPFCSLDHIGPKSVIKVEVGIDVPPPPIVGSHSILPGFLNTIEGILGDLQFSVSISTSKNKEGNYLVNQRVMSVAQQWSVFPVVPSTDFPQKPTSGQLDDQMTAILPEDRRPDNWVLDVSSHW